MRVQQGNVYPKQLRGDEVRRISRSRYSIARYNMYLLCFSAKKQNEFKGDFDFPLEKPLETNGGAFVPGWSV